MGQGASLDFMKNSKINKFNSIAPMICLKRHHYLMTFRKINADTIRGIDVGI